MARTQILVHRLGPRAFLQTELINHNAELSFVCGTGYSMVKIISSSRFSISLHFLKNN